MVIALLNFSGSVGKTTAAANLLAPRMNAPIYAIESTNESASDLGLDVETLRGAKFAELYRGLIVHPDAIVDVGASNVEAFLAAMIKQEGAHARIDRFVIPCLPNPKAQRETIKANQAIAVNRFIKSHFGPYDYVWIIAGLAPLIVGLYLGWSSRKSDDLVIESYKASIAQAPSDGARLALSVYVTCRFGESRVRGSVSHATPLARSNQCEAEAVAFAVSRGLSPQEASDVIQQVRTTSDAALESYKTSF